MTGRVSLWGKFLNRDGLFELGKVITCEVVRGLSAPADSLRAQIARESQPGELYYVEARHGGGILFGGEPDEQRFSVSGNGKILTVEARSAGAALLDNEAAPYSYGNTTVDAAHQLFLKPYGFSMRCPHPRARMATFAVSKGMSEWEAFSYYVWKAYGLSPWLDGKTAVVEKPAFPLRHTLSNTGNGVRFSRLEHENRRHRLLSRVYLRDSDGLYRNYVQNYVADRAGVQRKRYTVPPDEYADLWKLDAVKWTWRSLWEKEQVTAVLPGIHSVFPGDGAQVRQEGFPAGRLYVEEARYTVGKDGEATTLLLRDPAYYI